jgi:hypothetical protein
LLGDDSCKKKLDAICLAEPSGRFYPDIDFLGIGVTAGFEQKSFTDGDFDYGKGFWGSIPVPWG